ncbi:MAG: FlgO family outer membrane protein, partial [Verrucomicrobiota bacterium]|nr:FlgO family outer membrane protein [Verrucomicrobiota bacterium]
MAEAQRAVDLRADDAFEGPEAALLQARVFALLGEHERAFEALGNLVRIPAGVNYGELLLNPIWDALRPDPRFPKLLEEARRPIDPIPNVETPRPALAMSDKSIAVLPFANLSDDKANAFFADGVQDEVLTDLAKIADLKVISRTSVMQYRDSSTRNLRAIARELGVAHVLEGSVQRAGDRIRVNAQLIDARSDSHLWAEHYDRNIADVFTVQAEIAGAIAAQLQAKISPRERSAMAEKPTADLVAYDLYLRAKALRDEIATSKDWEADARHAVDLLDEAVSRDPDFLLAYCLLTKLHFTLYTWVDKTPARLALIETGVKNCVRIAPENAETHLVRGHWLMHEMNYAGALESISRAAETLSGSVEVFAYAADAEERLGRWEDATRDLEKAKALDPANPNIPNSLKEHYNARRDYTRSDRVADEAIARFPKGPGYFQAIKVRNALDRGDIPAARRALAAIAPNWDPSGCASLLRVLVSVADRNYEEARQQLATSRKANVIDRFAALLSFLEVLITREQGDEAKAVSILQSLREKTEAGLREMPNDIMLLTQLARVDAYLHRSGDALREIARAADLARDAIGRPEVLIGYAEVYLWAGERDQALQLLEEIATVPCGPTYGELLGPRWDGLRDDPRFRAIVEAARSVML